MSKKTKRIINIVLFVICLPILWFVGAILIDTITEFRPTEIMEAEVAGQHSEELKVGEDITVISWNLGYGALGAQADFFMDGGKGVNTATKQQVLDAYDAVAAVVKEQNPDLVLFQEVDVNSKRSHYVDGIESVMDQVTGYAQTYACNYKSFYVPYPLPTIGKVEAGLSTLSKFEITESNRYALPSPFKWPVSTCNLKRCLSVNRIPVKGSDKELVLVNLHLEAYDSGEGKILQTRILRDVLDTEVEKGNYVIAGGDFNQIFSNLDYSVVPLTSEEFWQPGVVDVTEFSSKLQFLMDTSTPSCRSLDKVYEGADKENFQYYILDGFIVSDNLEVNSVETLRLDFEHSDHNPVVLKLTVKE